MNKLAYFTLCLVCLTTALFSSCSDDEKVAQAAATLQAIKATSHSLEFTLTPQHAEQCAWMCYKKGETVPTAQDILKDGIPVSVSTTTNQRAIALEAETHYIIQAAALSRGQYVLSAPLEMKTLEYYEQDVPVVKLTLLDEALYRTDNPNKQGNYVLRFATAELANNKMPVTIGDVMVQLDLYHAPDADPSNATLPSGEYQMAKTLYDPYTWDAAHTIVANRISNDDSGLLYSQMRKGAIQVQRKGDTYTIEIDVTMEDGEIFRARFKGDIIFEEYIPKKPAADYEPFTQDQQVIFTEGQGRYFGSWFYPHADNLALEYFQGSFDENNNFVDGYYLYLTAYMHKLIDYNVEKPQLEAGTYQVFNQVGIPVNQLPMTINKGALNFIISQYYPQGSYLVQIDSKADKKYRSFITEGSMEVKLNGDQYDIVFHFKTAEGINLDMAYKGGMLIVNKNTDDEPDSQKPPFPMTTLKKNVTLAFDSKMKEVEASFMGSYLYPGLNSWIIHFVYPDAKADMITTEFFTDANQGMFLAEGTYEISKKFEPMCALPGFRPFKSEEVIYTWYGDMRTLDADGYATTMAPIASGTMTITKTAAGYKFVFDYVDDGGNKIQGEWEGKVNIKNYSGR